MDPMELSSWNELLDRIAALGVTTDYDQSGLKPDQREINSPPVTHQIAVVEEQCSDSPSILRTNYVRIPELSEPDTRLREDMAQALNCHDRIFGIIISQKNGLCAHQPQDYC